jgi:hypothetical protein
MRLAGVKRYASVLSQIAQAATFCCTSRSPWQQQQQLYTTSVELIGKWQSVLSDAKNALQPNIPILQAEHLRQLLNDAIHVYKTEGAAAVVPDQVMPWPAVLLHTSSTHCLSRWRHSSSKDVRCLV